MAIEIILVDRGQEHLLETVADGVFDNQVKPGSLTAFLNDHRHCLVIAVKKERVIGMATGVIYIHPDKIDEMWINEVAVAKAYRRQGIASKMLKRLFVHAKANGCSEAWVATEIDNKAGRGLYRKVKGAEEHVIMYSFDL